MGSYFSVRRFVLRRVDAQELPFRRMECAPGQELQVDFGLGALVMEEGKRRRPHLLRAVLSHSRKGYSEVVWRQTSESFLRCLENAFRSFGGVPATVVIDNLKAGVIQADWYDPVLNPKLEEFARHYGTVILPTKPVMPRHKGKVESAVKYAQNNAVKGRTFESLTVQNAYLADWEKSVADTRIHGTTRRQVGRLFEEVERPALQPLPATAPWKTGASCSTTCPPQERSWIGSCTTPSPLPSRGAATASKTHCQHQRKTRKPRSQTNL